VGLEILQDLEREPERRKVPERAKYHPRIFLRFLTRFFMRFLKGEDTSKSARESRKVPERNIRKHVGLDRQNISWCLEIYL